MSTSGQVGRYLSHVHNFRGFAIILIIITHCISVFDWSNAPVLALFLKRLVANGTIFFLFIAGYLFQHLSARYRVGDYLWRKFKYVVVPYVVVSTPGLLLFTLFMERPDMPSGFYDKAVSEQVVFFMLTGSHLAPFWFIPTVIVFYVASPLLHWLDRQPLFYYSLPMLMVIPLYVSRGYLNPVQSFVHFVPVWVLGMACSRYRETAGRWLEASFWFLVSLAAALLALEMLLAKGTHSWYSSISKIAVTLVLFALFMRLGPRGDRLFGLAGTLSFGLFFLHSYLISAGKIALERVLGGLPAGSLLGFIVVSALAVTGSIGLVSVVRRVLGRHSRVLIGV
ncbi:MAG: acyltransferase [Thauera phenolivorans]|uniref:Acyltransferase n=1 Tax=Thauera phenolivorans TaxID=1792543 RepID=A0A7X7LZG0_9RHOO|nr:acyltransferase [Thauera phenolivorans]